MMVGSPFGSVLQNSQPKNVSDAPTPHTQDHTNLPLLLPQTHFVEEETELSRWQRFSLTTLLIVQIHNYTSRKLLHPSLGCPSMPVTLCQGEATFPSESPGPHFSSRRTTLIEIFPFQGSTMKNQLMLLSPQVSVSWLDGWAEVCTHPKTQWRVSLKTHWEVTPAKLLILSEDPTLRVSMHRI